MKLLTVFVVALFISACGTEGDAPLEGVELTSQSSAYHQAISSPESWKQWCEDNGVDLNDLQYDWQEICLTMMHKQLLNCGPRVESEGEADTAHVVRTKMMLNAQ